MHLTNTKKTMPKNVTIKDIAREAGVSVALVSFVMNNRVGADGKQKYRVGEETRKRILEVAQRMDYRPMSRMLHAQRQMYVTGVILPNPADPYFGLFAATLERLALPQGCTLLFGYSLEDPVRLGRLWSTFRDKKVDALVLVSTTDEKELIEDMRRSGIPLVIPPVGDKPEDDARLCANLLFTAINNNENHVISPQM